MKQLAVVLVLLLAACSQAPVQEWKVAAADHLDRYKRAELGGDPRVALAEFQGALRQLKRSGDLAQVGKAHLTRCALENAMLIFGDCPDYAKLAALEPTAANQAYYRLLTLASQAGDEALLPPAYREAASMLGKPAAADLARHIGGVADPVSRLILCGLAVKAGSRDPAILRLAAETAAYHGWQRAYRAYRSREAQELEAAGNADAARKIRRALELLQ